MNLPDKRSDEQKRDDAVAVIARCIGTLQRWQQHLRNPKKNHAPLADLTVIAHRLTAAQERLGPDLIGRTISHPGNEPE